MDLITVADIYFQIPWGRYSRIYRLNLFFHYLTIVFYLFIADAHFHNFICRLDVLSSGRGLKQSIGWHGIYPLQGLPSISFIRMRWISQRSRVENGFCISKVTYQSSEYEAHASCHRFRCMRKSCQNVKGYEINWRRFGAWDHGVKQISWKREKGRWFLFLFSYSIFLLDYCYKFCLSLCERLDYFYAGS